MRIRVCGIPPQRLLEWFPRLPEIEDRVLFGSDFPVLTAERWMKDFDTLDLKPEVRQKILLDNAKKLLNLE